MWVNHKLRRDCLGNPSKLGGGPQENGEPRNPSAGARVPSLRRRGAANWDGCDECLSVTRATLCHARSPWRCGWEDSGEGLGGEIGLFPLVDQLRPWERRVGV